MPDALADGLGNFLWEHGAVGVVEEERPPAPGRLRAFFPAGVAPDATLAALRGYGAELRALGLGEVGEASIRAVADADWHAAWRAHFRPLPVGRRLLVRPPWEPAPADGRVALTIEPGRAFGTGHHGTTAGCLEWLEAICDAGAPATAIDLGTGSGILAIAAARLGVGAVLAVDDDPDAVATAEANAGINGVAARVTCRRAEASALAAPAAPLVIANLLTAAHLRLASCYARLLAPGGTLVLGGILDGEGPEVEAAVTAQGLIVLGATSREGWTTLALRRPA